MGQAKKRGDYEQRKRDAIIRHAEEIRKAHEEAERVKEEKKRQFQEWWDGLTPEQQEQERMKAKQRRSERSMLYGILGMAFMMSASCSRSRRLL
jgi:hypothetical protein